MSQIQESDSNILANLDAHTPVKLNPFLIPPKNKRQLILNPEVRNFKFLQGTNNPYLFYAEGFCLYRDAYFIVLKRETRSLAELLKANQVISGNLMEIFLEIACAIKALCEQNFAHMGLLPSNIYLFDSGSQHRIKIGGFKSSIHLPAKDLKTSITLSRPPYLCINSPPYFFLKKTFKPIDFLNADIWAFGCVLYEMATLGDHPFTKYLNADEKTRFEFLEQEYSKRNIAEIFDLNKVEASISNIINRCFNCLIGTNNNNDDNNDDNTICEAWNLIIQELQSQVPSTKDSTPSSILPDTLGSYSSPQHFDETSTT